MANESDRLAQIFIWKQATTPDIEYARQVLSAVNPGALGVLDENEPPLRFFTLLGQWPTDLWERAMYDMSATPNPEGNRWTDTNHYDLAGWKGTDQRTGEKLFIVTAYRKGNGQPQDAFQVAPMTAPQAAPAPTAPSPVPQVPYYPQRPTGPLMWPPQTAGAEPQAEALEPQNLTEEAVAGTAHENTGQLSGHLDRYRVGRAGRTGYPAIYNRAMGQVPAVAVAEPLPDSYAPYYVGFPQRLVAWLIDFFFMGLAAIAALYVTASLQDTPEPTDFGSWLAAYLPPTLVGLTVFALYHIVQWATTGRSIGKSLMGIKVVDADGNKPGIARSMVRMLGYFFSLFGGFFLIAFDPRRQGLHDKLAETYVVPEAPEVAVPRGLPGYKTPPLDTGIPTRPQPELPVHIMAAANVGNNGGYESVEITPGGFEAANQGHVSDFRGMYADEHGLQTVTVLPDIDDGPFSRHPATTVLSEDIDAAVSMNATVTGSLTTGGLNRKQVGYSVDRARELYRQGIEQMVEGVQPSTRGYKVEAGASRMSALALKGAVELVPNSVLYRYSYGVALRYSEGFELAISEFRRVLELDPSYFEARQQVAYGPRWHDAFAYTPWQPLTEAEGNELPASLLALLPAGTASVTRLALLREGTSKVVAVLTRTPRSTWAQTLTEELPAHIDIMLSRTPHGPIIAFYLVVEDRPGDPYKGETFLNPHDPGYPAYDACQLGQNLVSQLKRQDHTYLIFVDENNKLLMSRKLEFDPQTQVKINQCMYEIQSLPAQAMEAQRFQQAAQWHMQNFSLDQIV